MAENLSAADIMALTKDNDDNGWMNNPFIYLIWIWCFSMFGGGFGGFGNRDCAPANNCVTSSQMQDQFNFASLERQNNEIIDAIHQAQYNTVSETKNMAYTNLGQIRDVEAMLAGLQYQQSSCCYSFMAA